MRDSKIQSPTSANPLGLKPCPFCGSEAHLDEAGAIQCDRDIGCGAWAKNAAAWNNPAGWPGRRRGEAARSTRSRRHRTTLRLQEASPGNEGRTNNRPVAVPARVRIAWDLVCLARWKQKRRLRRRLLGACPGDRTSRRRERYDYVRLESGLIPLRAVSLPRRLGSRPGGKGRHARKDDARRGASIRRGLLALRFHRLLKQRLFKPGFDLFRV